MANSIGYDASIDLKQMRKDLKKIEQSFIQSTRDINTQMSRQDSVFSGMLKADAVKAAMNAAVTLVKEGINKIVSETSQLQDATLNWEMLTGSAEEAGVRIKGVYDFANKTPFDTKEVNEAATNLYKVSQGALGAEKDLIRLGDAAKKGNVPIVELSTTYGRLFNKLKNGEKAFGDEINRMTDLGLVTFKTKQELQKMDASLLKSEGIKLLNADLDKANGTMERFSENISGKLGTLSSTWDQIFAFDDESVVDGITKSIDGIIKALEYNKPTIQKIISESFSVLTEFTNDWIRGAIKIYDLFNNGSDEHRDYIRDLIELSNTYSTKRQDDLKIEKQIAALRAGTIKNDLKATKLFATNLGKGGGNQTLGSTDFIKERQKIADNFSSAIAESDVEKLLEYQDAYSASISDDFDKLITQLVQNKLETSALNNNLKANTNSKDKDNDKDNDDTGTGSTVSSKLSIDYSKLNFKEGFDTLGKAYVAKGIEDNANNSDIKNLLNDGKVNSKELNRLLGIIAKKDTYSPEVKEIEGAADAIRASHIKATKLSEDMTSLRDKMNDTLNYGNGNTPGGTTWAQDDVTLKKMTKVLGTLNANLAVLESKGIYHTVMVKDSSFKINNTENLAKAISLIDSKEKTKELELFDPNKSYDTSDGISDLDTIISNRIKRQNDYNDNVLNNRDNTDNTDNTDKTKDTADILGILTGGVNSTDQTLSQIKGIHEAWKADTTKTLAEGLTSGFSTLQSASKGASGTFGSIDALFGTGLSSLIPGFDLLSAGLGLASTLSSLFIDDEDASNGDSTITDTTASNRAQIVSSGPENIYVTNNFTITAGYIGDEVGTQEFFESEIAPRINDASAAVL